MITAGSKVIAQRFKSTSALRFFPQMRKYAGHSCTVVEVNGDRALVEFPTWTRYFMLDGGSVRFVWPVSALSDNGTVAHASH